jgi:hypothetical protein
MMLGPSPFAPRRQHNHPPGRRRGYNRGGRGFLNPWFDPFLNGAFAAPWEAWGEVSGLMAVGIWCFVIIMVLFMVVYGGPRY